MYRYDQDTMSVRWEHMSSNKDMTDKEITILEEALFRSGGKHDFVLGTKCHK